ncbi:MAG: hypothetical protein QNM02_15525, partial [Acidimicrobiia bacterium]|nr:hypothetical protein [Acidimicrobiia bacterium]
MTADKTYEEYRSLAESRLARFREQPLLHFIDGRPTPSANGATFENHSPTDGSSLGVVASGDAIDVVRAARAPPDAVGAGSGRNGKGPHRLQNDRADGNLGR